MPVLLDRSEVAHLAGLGIGEIQLVGSERDSLAPHAIAQLQLLTIFGVAGVARKRELRRIVRGQRVQVLIDESFKARPVTGFGGPGRTPR